MDKKMAKMLNDLMIRHYFELNQSLIEVMEECDEEIFKKYRLTIGKVLAIEFEEVMIPIYKLYPDLKPKELD